MMADIKPRHQKEFMINKASSDSKKPADLEQFKAHPPAAFEYEPSDGVLDKQLLSELYKLYGDMKAKLQVLETRVSQQTEDRTKTQWELSNVLSTPGDEMRAYISRNPLDFIFMLRQMFTYIAGFDETDQQLVATLNRLVHSDASGYNFVVAEMERNTLDLKRVGWRD